MSQEQQQQRYFVGLDLGQAADFTALAILERPIASRSDPRPSYALRHLQRFQLGTAYPDIVQAVVAMLKKPPLIGAMLVVDRTGVGRAVVDMLEGSLRGKVNCLLWSVTITAGQDVSFTEKGTNVPKKDLVGVLQVLLQTRRLQVARSLPDAAILVRELENFKVKITASAHETFESWREGQHDDLVLAVAMAAWVSEQAVQAELQPPRTVTRYIA